MTAGKKPDRKALPEPGATAAAAYAEPRNPVEAGIQKIWEAIFAKSPIGIDDNFFELGGHSLTGIRMVNEINEKFHVNVPLVEIFKILTIRGIADYVMTAGKTGYTGIDALDLRFESRLGDPEVEDVPLPGVAPPPPAWTARCGLPLRRRRRSCDPLLRGRSVSPSGPVRRCHC